MTDRTEPKPNRKVRFAFLCTSVFGFGFGLGSAPNRENRTTKNITHHCISSLRQVRGRQPRPAAPKQIWPILAQRHRQIYTQCKSQTLTIPPDSSSSQPPLPTPCLLQASRHRTVRVACTSEASARCLLPPRRHRGSASARNLRLARRRRRYNASAARRRRYSCMLAV